MLAIAAVYTGLTSALLGMIFVVWPPAFPGMHNRWQSLVLLAAGLAVAALGSSLPAKETRITAPRADLDRFMPVYQFSEFHSLRAAASKEKAYGAIKLVTAGEIRFFGTLTWLRRFGRSSPEGILNAPADKPILDVAARSGFFALTDQPDRELVLGTFVITPKGWRPTNERTPEGFKSLNAPGFALATINFRVEDSGQDACIVTTETRIYATDIASRRRFARYWRVIYPGSALIRREWLRAIARRARVGSAK